MRVPLIVKAIVDKFTEQQKLEIWHDGKQEFINAPFEPYFYSTYQLNSEYTNRATEELLEKTLLSSLEKRQIYKYSVPNTKYIYKYKEDDSIEYDLNYIERVLIDQPNFFLKYANFNNLKILFFDIEVDTDGLFPTPKRNAITAICLKCSDGQKRVFLADTFNDDSVIIDKFFKFLNEFDPDIIAHFNGNKFDIPYVNARAKISGISTKLWSRTKEEPFAYKEKMSLGGRISFDIYNQAILDQTLSGIKNHKMKTLAKWLKFPEEIIEVPYDQMRAMVGTSKLKQYVQSDVKITEFLFNIYFRNVLVLAEMFNTPLNVMVDSTASFISKIHHGRELLRLGIVCDGNNGQRNPIYIKKKKGAMVDTITPGLYNHEIFKVDYSSEYPRAVETFNLSPETVKILRYEKYTGQYKFDISDPKKYIFSIPDDVADKNIVIQIDMSKKGFLSQYMHDVLEQRAIIKKEMKLLNKGTPEYESKYVIQNALKIVANATTGYHGAQYSPSGCLGVYCAITGMGRWYLQAAIKAIKEQKK